MKKILSFIICIALALQTVSAASIQKDPVKASDVTIPIGNTGKVINLQDLSKISVKDFEKLTGKDMKFTDRLILKAAQKKLRNSINNDGTINNKKIEKFYKKHSAGGTADFNIGGFALGFLLFLIGVLIAYILKGSVNDGDGLVKWAWIGAAASLALSLILVLASL